MKPVYLMTATLFVIGQLLTSFAANSRTLSLQDLLKKAEQGDAQAQYNLGECYADGAGVAKDVAEAVKWYRKAAEQGHAPAQNALGWCYANGEGVTKDVHEAVKWYRKAADQKHEKAQQALRSLGIEN